MVRSLPREFNSVAEQMAAERRAAVAAAVSQQEFRDRVEYKFGGLGSRGLVAAVTRGVDDIEADGFEDESRDRNLVASYLASEPEQSNPRVTTSLQRGGLRTYARRNAYCIGLLLFVVTLLGSVSLFWGSMHHSAESVIFRPDVAEADPVPVNKEVQQLLEEGVAKEALAEAAEAEQAKAAQAKAEAAAAAAAAAADEKEPDEPAAADKAGDKALHQHFKSLPRKADKKGRKRGRGDSA